MKSIACSHDDNHRKPAACSKASNCFTKKEFCILPTSGHVSLPMNEEEGLEMLKISTSHGEFGSSSLEMTETRSSPQSQWPRQVAKAVLEYKQSPAADTPPR
mmetsp:Transcript_20318/g.56101  ORF Transcript_20318/g.56101 Transcript_20318/m.56101 type:complete len:102 (-) Transcript_20318:1110-1415(-)